MDISEVARRSGVAASALRYYERRGLIRSLGQDDGARRKFSPAVLDQLALIALGQAAGFSLDEIRAMFTPAGETRIDRAMLSAKADELDRTVKRLKAMSEGLRHAAACPAPSHAECPSFQRLLKAAAAGALETRQGRLAPRQSGCECLECGSDRVQRQHRARPVPEGRQRLAAVFAAMALEGLARAIGAGAAGGADAQFRLKFVEARAAAAHFALDLAIGDAVTDTDDHGEGGAMDRKRC